MALANVSNTTNITQDFNPFTWIFDFDLQFVPSDNPLAFEILDFMILMPVSILLSSFGTVTNIINVAIFYRQGLLADNCTPSLVVLAVTDFFYCLITLVDMLIYIPNTIESKASLWLAFELVNIRLMVTTPKRMLTQMTCFVTVYLSFERMICVAFPFKVKSMFTPKRSYFAIFVLLLVCFVLKIPYTFQFSLTWARLCPDCPVVLNRQETGMIPYDLQVMDVLINSVILRFLSIIFVVAFNIIIMIKVNVSKQFKKSATSTNLAVDTPRNTDKTKQEPASDKELKLIRMMVVLSAMFLVCYIFISIIRAMHLIYGFYGVFSRNTIDNTAYVLRFADTLEMINSSCNIVIYYTMSSKYKKELGKLLSCCKRKNL